MLVTKSGLEKGHLGSDWGLLYPEHPTLAPSWARGAWPTLKHWGAPANPGGPLLFPQSGPPAFRGPVSLSGDPPWWPHPHPIMMSRDPCSPHSPARPPEPSTLTRPSLETKEKGTP